jgi:hypothetical protein
MTQPQANPTKTQEETESEKRDKTRLESEDSQPATTVPDRSNGAVSPSNKERSNGRGNESPTPMTPSHADLIRQINILQQQLIAEQDKNKRLLAGHSSRAPGGRSSVTPALPHGGGPPSIRAGEDVLDVIIDKHNVEFVALVSVVLGQFRIDFPPNPVGRLLLPQEDKVVELGGMVAISIGWWRDGDLGGNGQPLDDTAGLVVRDANDHGISSSSNRV